jgi:hypothetical protein
MRGRRADQFPVTLIDDGRRVVFHTMLAMYEVHHALR